MEIFDFTDYRAWIRKRVEAMPRKGHGQFRKIAAFLKIQTSLMSQIMSGERELNPEGASLLCDYFGLTELEGDYFLLLVHLSRAGNERLRKQLHRQMEQLRTKAREIDHRIPKEAVLSESAKATFYSQWYYSGIRLASAIEGLNSADVIARRLNLPPSVVARVVEFLTAEGLCVNRNGKLAVGPRSTHLASDSPLVTRHHMNWRMKAMENFEGIEPHEILFTGPAAISAKDSEKVRKLILGLIDEWAATVDASGSEKLTCLNIDWVDIA